MTEKLIEWEKATQAINAAQSILIVTHISPDGDAIGSALGLANALKQMGKTVTVADDDGVPDFLKFLPHADTVVQYLKKGSWDVMISTDASDDERTGEVGIYGRAHSKTVINLDHHVTNTYFGDIYLVVPSAVSATEIVFDWWETIGIDWNHDIAMPLLTGLVTDTLGFRISSVTARTLEVAQSLMRYGGSLAEAMARTLESKSWKEVALWKQVLPSAVLRGQIVEAVITPDDIAAVGLTEMGDAGLVSFLRKVDEAVIAVVFKQHSEREVIVSLRSKQGYDVAEVALALGGGGHAQASGATIFGTLDDARAKVLPLLEAAAEKGKPEIA
ncbi:MAG: bifunctional oligoribonuclease/PAP phosphatase NrnA [Anaerolineae bacterium]|nr:bifunctional oligoribonuclease/PAP phosphatase NrnA [Anaerolineae bacterium]MDQ7035404.1 bifunctional oligoribonuclease/PAP phosphatase NrnA [Anaerolineae bacterium]